MSNRFAFRFLLVIGALAVFVGCAPSLPSPPASALHLATPASVGEGRTAVTGGAAAGGEVFGPGLVVAEASVRHGVSSTVDVGGSASAAVVLGDQLADPPHRGVYAARAFTHFAVAPRWLAFHVGLGGGGSAAGGFLSPDVGLTLGYENRYLVPYAHGTFVGSVPFATRTLDLRRVDDTQPDPRTAYASFGSRFGAGLRVPVGPREAPVGSLFFELTLLYLAGNDPSEPGGVRGERGLMVGGVAYQHAFGGAPPLAPSSTVE